LINDTFAAIPRPVANAVWQAFRDYPGIFSCRAAIHPSPPQGRRQGIILFHDTKAETSAMLPAFLRYLRDNGYHLVHAIPVEPAAASNH
jgi:hypothetical protein